MKNEFIQRLRLLEGAVPHMELKAAQALVKYQMQLFRDYLDQAGKGAVWTNMVMPAEVIYAAGLKPIQTELIAGWLSTMNLASKYIHTAHSLGFSRSICSYHKAVIGALEEGSLPPPQAAVFSSHICDGGSLLGRYLRERFGTKVFFLDIPYHRTAEGIRLLARKIQQVMGFLEEYRGEKISMGEVRESLALSNRARHYLQLANELRMNHCLFPGYLSIRNMYGASFLLGSQTGLEVAGTYYEELKERKPFFPAGYRILWIHFAPLYGESLMRYLEETLHLSIAFDITGHIYWKELNRDSPFVSLAEKMLSHFYLEGTKERLLMYDNIIHSYHIDGIIMFQQHGCRSISCSFWEIEEVSGKNHIPCLGIAGDCIHPEGCAREQIKLRMEAFAERVVSK